jgi:hypothetical protein
MGMPDGFLSNGIARTPEREFLTANLSAASTREPRTDLSR